MKNNRKAKTLKNKKGKLRGKNTKQKGGESKRDPLPGEEHVTLDTDESHDRSMISFKHGKTSYGENLFIKG